MVLGALGAVVVGEAVALDLEVLAHVDGPGVVRVAGQQAVGADFDAGAVDERVMRAAVVAVGVAAHGDKVWGGLAGLPGLV
jgi:hypothetical protein